MSFSLMAVCCLLFVNGKDKQVLHNNGVVHEKNFN